MEYLGEIAALTTAFMWSFTAIFFSEAGRLIGSFHVNKIRLIFAVLIYTLVLTLTYGSPWPQRLNFMQIVWLGFSGLIGLVFGDGCGFKALVMIGPRRSTLIMASAPIMATLIAWFFLDEKLKLLDLGGIALTIAGIVWVISERTYGDRLVHESHPDSGTQAKGVILALGAALGQAAGLVFSKQGMLNAGGVVQPMQASYVRMLTALVFIWLLSAGRGTFGAAGESFRDRKAMAYTFAGAVAGPFLGVWMSLVAVAHIKAGIAATLNATTPVLIIPTLIFYYHEKISWRAILGALVAVAGVAILLLA